MSSEEKCTLLSKHEHKYKMCLQQPNKLSCTIKLNQHGMYIIPNKNADSKYVLYNNIEKIQCTKVFSMMPFGGAVLRIDMFDNNEQYFFSGKHSNAIYNFIVNKLSDNGLGFLN